MADEQEETYLGDGLYASFDGWQIKLRAPRESYDHVVYLEPEVYRELVRYAGKCYGAHDEQDHGRSNLPFKKNSPRSSVARTCSNKGPNVISGPATALGKLDHWLIMNVGSVASEQVWDMVELAIKEEREACAKIAEGFDILPYLAESSTDPDCVQKRIAEKIRARSKTEQ